MEMSQFPQAPASRKERLPRERLRDPKGWREGYSGLKSVSPNSHPLEPQIMTFLGTESLQM